MQAVALLAVLQWALERPSASAAARLVEPGAVHQDEAEHCAVVTAIAQESCAVALEPCVAEDALGHRAAPLADTSWVETVVEAACRVSQPLHAMAVQEDEADQDVGLACRLDAFLPASCPDSSFLALAKVANSLPHRPSYCQSPVQTAAGRRHAAQRDTVVVGPTRGQQPVCKRSERCGRDAATWNSPKW